MKNLIRKFLGLSAGNRTILSVFSLVFVIFVLTDSGGSAQTTGESPVPVAPKVEAQTATADASKVSGQILAENPREASSSPGGKKLYSVIKVVDGDTIDVSIDGKIERLRLIGINTPETVDPRKPVECFGVEASNRAKEILTGKSVYLESDPTQGERDKYERLLRYIYLPDGANFNLTMIQDGYAYEYTYDVPYKYQSSFKDAQKIASANKSGLWADGVCQAHITQPTIVLPSSVIGAGSCTIKGNISAKGEKIFHVDGCGSYSKTVIDESKGERWFCTEQDALDAGWRKALNCN